MVDESYRPRVLIADDEPVVRAAISAQLKGKFDVIGEAGDAAGAIRFARKYRPDVALVDVEMPGGGLHATQVIHGESPETAIVILSSDTARSSVLRFTDAGAVAFLRKGTSGRELAKRLNQAFHARQLAERRVEHVRQAADDRFRAAFDEAGAGMAIMPLEGEDAGRLVTVNSAYARILGREADSWSVATSSVGHIPTTCPTVSATPWQNSLPATSGVPISKRAMWTATGT
jgi:CheY-like chemotaxis protein